MRISSDAFQRQAEPQCVWAVEAGVLLWSETHPHSNVSWLKSWKIFWIWDKVHATQMLKLCCSKYGDSWQRFLLEVNTTCELLLLMAWRTCWMWSPRPPAASSSFTKSPLTIGCSSCTTNLPPVYFFSPLSWLLPSKYYQVQNIVKFKLRSCELMTTLLNSEMKNLFLDNFLVLRFSATVVR